MFMLINGVVSDWDLDMLSEVLLVLDKQIAGIVGDDWQTNVDADSLGYFDRAEHIMGLGFVACQAYMTSTYGFLDIHKGTALAIGPCHRTGRRVAEIVNHAANYWKHHEEWHLDRSSANQDRIRAAFDDLGFPVDLDYPLSCILAELVDPVPVAFTSLVPKFASWRDDLRGVAR